MTNQPIEPFSEYDHARYMLLTTFKRDGTPVPTPVGVYKVGERLFFLTDPASGKAKRIRRNPHVTVAPCTMRGAPKGHTIHARAWVLDLEEAERIAVEFAAVRPVLFHLGRLLYDLRGRSMIFVELLTQVYPPLERLSASSDGRAA